MGYFTPTYLKAVIEEGAFFLNRLPSQINFYTRDNKIIDWEGIHRKFEKTGTRDLDIYVKIYQKDQLACRLVIERVGEDEYNKRMKKAIKSAKSRGIGVSKKIK